MKGRQLRRRFSLQPSFMKDDEDKPKKDKPQRSSETDASDVHHKIVVMGAGRVGKTSIITQFLYGQFSTKYKRTVEEMHKGEFCIGGVRLVLDILDTSGSFEFPAMRALSIGSADAFILVYDASDPATFDELTLHRSQIHSCKATTSVPIVVVSNKADLLTDVEQDERELVRQKMVEEDWKNGFVSSSAKENRNVTEVFKELLVQAKITYNLSPALRRRRRQSLPMHQNQSGGRMPSGTMTPVHGAAAHVPSAAQLQHLQQLQERSLGQSGKRQSCVIS